jgi:hypothetical protein
VKKIAQNVVQAGFLSNLAHSFFRGEKSCPKIRTPPVIPIKNCPKKIAQWAKIRPIWSPWFGRRQELRRSGAITESFTHETVCTQSIFKQITFPA